MSVVEALHAGQKHAVSLVIDSGPGSAVLRHIAQQAQCHHVSLGDEVAGPGDLAALRDCEERIGLTVQQAAAIHSPWVRRLATGLSPLGAAPANLVAQMGAWYLHRVQAVEAALSSAGHGAVVTSGHMAPMVAPLVAKRGLLLRIFETEPSIGLSWWADADGGVPIEAGEEHAKQWPRTWTSWRSGPSTALIARLFSRRRRYRAGGFASGLPSGTSTVLFVLEPEPSPNLGRFCDTLVSQHAALLVLCRDLPAGTVVAICEHPAMIGRRPVEFYSQLRDLKMVRLIPPNMPFAAMCRDAVAVAGAGLASTLIAAMQGLPALSFARRSPWRGLPGITIANDPGDVAAEARHVLSARGDLGNSLDCLARSVFLSEDIETAAGRLMRSLG